GVVLGDLEAVEPHAQPALQGREAEAVIPPLAPGIRDVALEAELLADDLGKKAVRLVVMKIQPRQRLHDGAERLRVAALAGADGLALVVRPPMSPGRYMSRPAPCAACFIACCTNSPRGSSAGSGSK